MSATAPTVLSPQDTAALLRSDNAAHYVDVRTVGEFAQGRPLGRAVNIPFEFKHPVTQAAVPNASFVEVVRELFSPETPLVLGAEPDGRAEAAADALARSGFQRVSVMPDGLSGWRMALLPTTRDNRDGVSYVSLLMRFRRKGKKSSSKAAGH